MLSAVYVTALQHFPPAAAGSVFIYMGISVWSDAAVRQNDQLAVLQRIVYTVDVFFFEVGILHGNDTVNIVHQLNGFYRAILVFHNKKGFVVNNFV